MLIRSPVACVLVALGCGLYDVPAMDYEGSYIRWQAIAIRQLGYAIDLILSFAAASLGFALSVVKDPNYPGRPCGKGFMLAALLSLALSLAAGIWCVINRLLDFRKTAKIARDRESWRRKSIPEGEIDERLQTPRAAVKTLGKRTWRLFWWQIGTLAAGILMLLIALVITYRIKLF